MKDNLNVPRNILYYALLNICAEVGSSTVEIEVGIGLQPTDSRKESHERRADFAVLLCCTAHGGKTLYLVAVSRDPSAIV